MLFLFLNFFLSASVTSNGTKIEEKYETGGVLLNNGFGYSRRYRKNGHGEKEWYMKLLFPANEIHPVILCRFLGQELAVKSNFECGECGCLTVPKTQQYHLIHYNLQLRTNPETKPLLIVLRTNLLRNGVTISLNLISEHWALKIVMTEWDNTISSI